MTMKREIISIALLFLFVVISPLMADPTPPPPPESPVLPQVLFKKEVIGKYIKREGALYIPLTLLADKMEIEYKVKGNSLVISGKAHEAILLKKDDIDYIRMDDAGKVLKISIKFDEKAKKVFITPSDSK
ncbi:MAG: hypothetical protein AB2L14_27050 [Candidatus Xenobiia bacterium LiM19]